MHSVWLGARARAFVTVAVLGVSSIILADPAFAQDLKPVNTVLERIVAILTGTPARLVAIIAVAAMGYAAHTGRIPWRWGASIIVGMVLVFGSASIVDWLSGAVS